MSETKYIKFGKLYIENVRIKRNLDLDTNALKDVKIVGTLQDGFDALSGIKLIVDLETITKNELALIAAKAITVLWQAKNRSVAGFEAILRCDSVIKGTLTEITTGKPLDLKDQVEKQQIMFMESVTRLHKDNDMEGIATLYWTLHPLTRVQVVGIANAMSGLDMSDFEPEEELDEKPEE